MKLLRKIAVLGFLSVVAIVVTAIFYYSESGGSDAGPAGELRESDTGRIAGVRGSGLSSAAVTSGVENEALPGADVYWKPGSLETERVKRPQSDESSPSFRILQRLNASEVRRLIPEDFGETRAAWSIAVDPEALEAVLSGASDRLTLPTPEGWIGRVSKRVQRGDNTTSVMGSLEGAAGNDFLLVAHAGVLFGHIADYAEGVHYELRTATGGELLVRQLDQSARTAVCGIPDHVELLEEGSSLRQGHEQCTDRSCIGETPLLTNEMSFESEALHTVDIVVGYSAAARAADGGTAQIEARIISSVDRMNLAFDNSGLTPGAVELVLLATIEDPFYSDPGLDGKSMSEELSDLNNPNDGALDTVSDLATHLGADLQAFIVRGVQGSAGLAYRPGRSSITARSYMSSDSITFVHELGHNFGLKHSWGDSSSDSVTTLYNYGWRLRGSDGNKYRTIMAYDWGWSRIPYFANPGVAFQGVPTGAAVGYDASGDERTDSRYVSGGLTGTAGAGFDGSNPLLGASAAIYLEERAQYVADNRDRTSTVPVILVPPRDATIVAGEGTSLSVLAGGEGTLTYQWQRNGIDLHDSEVFQGTHTETLSFLNARLEDSGDYRVIVRNLKGTAVSSIASVEVVLPVPPVITSQPGAQNRNEGESVIFEVAATGSPAPSYQWQKDGIDIIGAIERTLKIQAVRPQDAAEYTCRVSNLGGTLLSVPARLIVNGRPVVSIASPWAATIRIPSGVGLRLEATVSDDGLPVPSDLFVSWSAPEMPIGGNARFEELTSEDTRVNFDAPGLYRLRLTADDGAIHASRELRVLVGDRAAVVPGTGVNLERFDGIPGNALADLLGSAAFINEMPDHTQVVLDFFEAPKDVGSNYGQRLRTFFLAPQSGEYTFWIASDDSSELYLSTDHQEAHKERIASVSGWARARQWDKQASQKSAPIALKAGEAYYMEVLHKEGSGGDHVAVGVTFPDGSGEFPLTIEHLALFEDAFFEMGPLVQTGGPYSVFVGEELALDATVTDDGATAPALLWQRLSGPGSAGFSDPMNEDPIVVFDHEGQYMLRLSASGGMISTFAEVVVEVVASPATVSLTVGSGPGGEVIPAGTFDTVPGQVFPVEARASAGYSFVNWTGDTGTVADPNAPNTTIRVDNTKTITANFERNNPVVAPYGESWRAQIFDAGATGPESEPLADYNGDGRANIIDYAFQIDSASSARAAEKLPQVRLHRIDGRDYLALQMRRIEGGEGDPSGNTYEIYGVRYHVEWHPDLRTGEWRSNAAALQMVGNPVSNEDGTETVVVRRVEPIERSATVGRGFMRVRIEILP